MSNSTNMVDPLNDNEKDEMKALQDERKIAGEGKGPQFTDSQRARLSELQNRETAEKEQAKTDKEDAKAEKDEAKAEQQQKKGGSGGTMGK